MANARLDQKVFQQLTTVVPDLDQWTSAAAEFDGSAPEALKFKAPGMMDLNVDILHRDGNQCEITMSHYYKHRSGDMIADPDMQVCIDFAEESAVAHTYQDSFGYQEVETDLAQYRTPGQSKNQRLSS